MTDISFLKAVIKWRRNGKWKNWQTYTPQTQTIKSIPRRGGINGGLLFRWQSLQTCNTQTLTCCVGFNWWDRLSASSRPGVWRGRRVMGNQSQDEWAQYRDLWGAKDHLPLQQGLAIDHHWGPIEEGMWLKQACVEQCSTVWPTCLSSWVSVPLIEGVDSLFMLHKAMSVPPSPLTKKGGFLWGAIPTIMWWPFPPQLVVLISWMDFVADIVYIFVCWWRGGGLKRKKATHWVT